MPTRSDRYSQRLPKGPSRHLDLLFRQQRYDSIEPIIDACYHAMQQLVLAKKEPQVLDYPYGMKTPNSTRYSLFRGVEFEALSFQDKKGALMRISFNCPRSLERNRIHKSSVLEHGMMCAIIGLHDDTDELTTTFFEVHMKESTVSTP
jgi:hypothetical protein